MEYEVLLVDATETPIERQKSKGFLLRGKRKNIVY